MPTAPEEMTLKVIAHIHTAFPTKFGIPRQSGLVEELRGEVVFTPEYRSAAEQMRGVYQQAHRRTSMGGTDSLLCNLCQCLACMSLCSGGGGIFCC